MSDATSGVAPRRAAFIFVFITVLLDMLALGMIIPVLPNLIKMFMGGDTAKAARMLGVFGTVWALMQFFFAPVLGSLSDRFGRRPVILLSNFGLACDYVLMALAPSVGWLFAGRVISGITAASVPTASAYIADVTPPEKRAGAFGMLGAAFGLGFVLGPALGGLLGSVDPRLPFWASAGLSGANALYGLFVLPESLPPEKRAAFSLKRANPLGSLKLLGAHRGLLLLAAVVFLGQLAHESLPSTFVLYAQDRYGWNERLIGLTLAAVGVCMGIVQGALVRPLVARFGERASLFLGLLCGAIGFLIYGLAATGPGFWIGIPVMAFWGLAGPAAQGMMSAKVGDSDQGQLQGATGSIRGISGLIGPTLYTQVFALFISSAAPFALPGAPFVLSAALIAVALLLAFSLLKAPRVGAELSAD
jgi:DHA1 family tetracycline resistance protein-like MFS transporter